MKMKTVTIDGEKWIKKAHYDKLDKRKVKVEKEELSFKDICCSNPSNTIAVVQLDNFRKDKTIVLPMKDKLVFKKFTGVVKIKDYNIKIDAPVVNLDGNFYNYDYIIEAKEIANALGTTTDYTPYIAGKDSQAPLLLDFINFGVLIAPREY